MTWKCNLIELLAERKMTQRKVARATGIMECSISHWANGDRTMNVLSAIKIAKVIGCKVEDLYTIKE